jgi:ABC-type nitrate/sulfonate/bicarbonate transport system permease component
LILAVWQTVSLFVTWIRDVPFPTPFETTVRLISILSGDIILDHTIYRHTLDSLTRWAAGFGMAVVCGLAFGLPTGWWRPLGGVAMPSVHILQLIPGLAWIPVAILFFGVGERATFFMICVTAFAPITINVVDGVKRVDENYLRAARMLGTRGKNLFLRVLLPCALPQIISGLRVGLGNSWRVLVAAEMIVGTGTGLGYAIIQSRWTMDYASAFICILVICCVGLIMERFVFSYLERRTIQRWGLGREL